jgi:hypothetical protein
MEGMQARAELEERSSRRRQQQPFGRISARNASERAEQAAGGHAGAAAAAPASAAVAAAAAAAPQGKGKGKGKGKGLPKGKGKGLPARAQAVPGLKEQCKRYQLPEAGHKQDLIDSLARHFGGGSGGGGGAGAGARGGGDGKGKGKGRGGGGGGR